MRARSDRARRRPLPTVMGLPIPLIVVALVLSSSIGLMLSKALEISTTGSSTISGTSMDSPGAPGKNSAGLPVISESTLGLEVQRVLDSGTVLRAPASFDVNRCFEQQGITETLLTMEEVAWGPEGVRAWLIIHGPVDRTTLNSNGGVVNATVVLPSCGVDTGEGADSSLLWSGSAMIGAV